MKRIILLILALGLSACRSTLPCTVEAHAACDLDGGVACAAHQSCVSVLDAVDACPPDATACCFQVCTQDSDCPTNQACVAGACAIGACADGG